MQKKKKKSDSTYRVIILKCVQNSLSSKAETLSLLLVNIQICQNLQVALTFWPEITIALFCQLNSAKSPGRPSLDQRNVIAQFRQISFREITTTMESSLDEDKVHGMKIQEDARFPARKKTLAWNTQNTKLIRKVRHTGGAYLVCAYQLFRRMNGVALNSSCPSVSSEPPSSQELYIISRNGKRHLWRPEVRPGVCSHDCRACTLHGRIP